MTTTSQLPSSSSCRASPHASPRTSDVNTTYNQHHSQPRQEHTMRHNRFLLAAAMATALTLGLAACSTPASNAGSVASTGTVNKLLGIVRSEEHTSELQSRQYLVCRLL